MLEQNQKDKAVYMAKVKADKENVSIIAIYTYGKGIELVSNDFSIDRNYYHGEGGQKMFFDPICKAHPAGLVEYYHRN